MRSLSPQCWCCRKAVYSVCTSGKAADELASVVLSVEEDSAEETCRVYCVIFLSFSFFSVELRDVGVAGGRQVCRSTHWLTYWSMEWSMEWSMLARSEVSVVLVDQAWP